MIPPEPLDHHTTRSSNSTQSSGLSSTPGGQHPHQPPHNPTILQVCAEVKPRLTKEQHDILERHFQQQPKPSTHTKKGFADMLGVPLDKINVCSYYGKSSAVKSANRDARTGSKIAEPKSSKTLKSSRTLSRCFKRPLEFPCTLRLSCRCPSRCHRRAQLNSSQCLMRSRHNPSHIQQSHPKRRYINM